MPHRRTATLVLAAALLVTPPARAAGGWKADVDELVAKAVGAKGPGAVVTIAKRGKVLHQVSRGLADLETGTPLGPKTLFDLASVSKHVTGVAVMLAAKQKRLKLEDDVRMYVKELPAVPGNRPIRVLDLLWMVSGLADYTQFTEDYAKVTNVKVAKAVAEHEMQFKTGKKYVYNNTDYALLALAVERATKRKLADYLHEEAFGPLGMKDTRVVDDPDFAAPNLVTGYKRGKKKGAWVRAHELTRVVGDGQVHSTAADLVKWDAALAANTLVPAALAKRAYTSGELDSGKKTGYGFGWTVDKVDGEPNVSHTGSWDGTSTYVTRYLTSGLTVIVLSNDEGLEAEQLGEAVASAVEE